MRNTLLALLVLFLIAPACSAAVEELVPAGTVFQCTVSEPKISSKTEDIGDPILCDVGYSRYSEQFGHARLPYDSYLVGHFEDFKDPGHFVGKGWMELKFERIVIEPNTVIPIHAKVVGVRGYDVDRYGRILGKGHAVRDTFAWMVPILWPIDVINLPRRGPRPTLKAETQLTLKVMDDFGVPGTEEPQEVSPGLMRREPSSYAPPPASYQPQESVVPAYMPETPPPMPYWPPPPPYGWYAAPPPMVAPWGPVGFYAQPRYPPYRPPYTGGPDARQPVTLIFNNGRPPELAYNYMLTPTTLYVLDGTQQTIPLRELDLAATRNVNREEGVDFLMRSTVYGQ